MSTVRIGDMVLSVEQIRTSQRYVVRPDGGLGTVGWFPFPWTAVFVRASDPITAARKAYPKLDAQRKGATP